MSSELHTFNTKVYNALAVNAGTPVDSTVDTTITSSQTSLLCLTLCVQASLSVTATLVAKLTAAIIELLSSISSSSTLSNMFGRYRYIDSSLSATGLISTTYSYLFNSGIPVLISSFTANATPIRTTTWDTFFPINTNINTLSWSDISPEQTITVL